MGGGEGRVSEGRTSVREGNDGGRRGADEAEGEGEREREKERERARSGDRRAGVARANGASATYPDT